MKRLFRWLNRKLNIVSDDPYYAWADSRLDELARQARHQYTPLYPWLTNSICTCGAARSYCERRK